MGQFRLTVKAHTQKAGSFRTNLNMASMWRIVVGMMFFWLVVLLYMSTTLYQSGDVTERTERQLSKALRELEQLKDQNLQLQKLANELRDIRVVADQGDSMESLRSRLDIANKKLASAIVPVEENQAQAPAPQTNCQVSTGPEPDLAQEQSRRRVKSNVQELWFYLKSELSAVKGLASSNTALRDKVQQMTLDVHDYQRVLMTDLHNLSQANNMEEWRIQEARDLTDIVQNRIHYLQNPEDCSKAKKLVCHLNKGCGYGCQLHHMIYCFIIAYGTQRTMILESRGWRYAQGGWEKVFLPLSETCTDRSGSSSRAWGAPEVIRDVQVVDLPIVDSLHPRAPYMPLSIPADLAPRLMRLHGNPAVWWIAQFLKYSLKPQSDLQADMTDTMTRLGFKSPIVGVHVRRTDKVGTEAAFHGLDEYMAHVDDYYKLLELKQDVPVRRIYLATDDPTLLVEARNKYPQYEIISDNGFSQSAGLGTRYSDSSLRGIILDIHFLSLTDHLVCTFSSQVCRVAYEIMQTRFPDASDRYYSLDDIFYFGGQNAHNVKALHSHNSRTSMEDIDMKAGDLVGIAGNHWNGYSKGQNRRTGKTGLFPTFKTEEKIEIVEFPTYADADKLLKERKNNR